MFTYILWLVPLHALCAVHTEIFAIETEIEPGDPPNIGKKIIIF